VQPQLPTHSCLGLFCITTHKKMVLFEKKPTNLDSSDFMLHLRGRPPISANFPNENDEYWHNAHTHTHDRTIPLNRTSRAINEH